MKSEKYICINFYVACVVGIVVAVCVCGWMNQFFFVYYFDV